jgi:hypothetical protein
MEAHHHIRDVTFTEDTASSRTGSGPANLATIRAAVIAAIRDAGYLHVPEGRRDHTTPAEALCLHGLDYCKTEADIHGTRRSPVLALRTETSDIARNHRILNSGPSRPDRRVGALLSEG